MLTNSEIWVIMRATVVISVNKREGDRAVYRLFALYKEFDKVDLVWYNG